MARTLHTNEIPIDIELVRALIDRAMPQYGDLPLRQLASSGSTNALFRLGDDLLVRLPLAWQGGRQHEALEALDRAAEGARETGNMLLLDRIAATRAGWESTLPTTLNRTQGAVGTR